MDDLIDELPVEKRHLSKLIIICRIKLMGDWFAVEKPDLSLLQ